MIGVIELNLFFSIPCRFILISLFSLTILLFLSSNVISQEKAIPSNTSETNKAKTNAEKSNILEKAKESEEVEISVKAPQAYYIMSRSSFNYENVGIGESFIPKIVKSVDEKPF